MKIIVKPIKNYCNVNNWDYSERIVINAGQPQVVHFQIWNEDHTKPLFLSSGSTVSVFFPRIPKLSQANSGPSQTIVTPQDVTISASQPSSVDSSVWSLNIQSSQSDLIAGGGFKLTIVESGVSKSYMIYNIIEKVLQ
jgi:hypothetical protein